MLARSLVIQSMRLGQFMSDEISCALHPYGLSIQQFNVLRILRGCQEKPASLQYITSRMIHKTSNTTRIVDRLLEKKLVDRKPCAENRRMVEINITEAGLKLLNSIDPVIDKKENEVASRLSEKELTTLLDNYKKLFVTL
ncbi:MAG: MarR family transcriptional regulator [Flavobacteriaceae bacterium]|nr:MarR family transcriptional regulator [Flavobacteriaceae bacterium]